MHLQTNQIGEELPEIGTRETPNFLKLAVIRLEPRKVQQSPVISFSGSNSHLYRTKVLSRERHKIKCWTPNI